MADVIIAYSGADEALVAPIAAQSRALGLDVLLAPQQEQDDVGAEAIETQIEDAGALLVCWSDHAVASSSIRTRAAIASARGKLTACRLAPCALPFPFDAAPTVDMQNWAERIESAEWEALVAGLGETLRRPGLSELLKARIAGGDDALNAFAKRFPDEPEARRIWSEREARYREECASMLKDARQHLEQRVASERSKIENALAAFNRDFDAWLERERRGEAAAKPSLNTLFEIWLERGGRRGEAKGANGAPPPADKRLEQNAAQAEAKALALQDRLDAESGRVRELERRLQAAELRAQRQSQSETLVATPISPALMSSARPKHRRGILSSVLAAAALSAVGVTALAKFVYPPGQEPPQMSAAIEWFGSTGAAIEARSREAIVRLVASEAGADVLNALLESDKDKTIARAVAFDPPAALAALREVAPEPRSEPAARPAAVSPDAALANASAEERREIVSAVVKAASSEALAQLLATRKDEAIEHLLRSERAALSARLTELAPQEARAPAEATAPPAAQQPLARLAQLPPREIVKTLEANVSPQNLAELGKLLSAATPQKLATYRTYDNRDVASDEATKLRTIDLQACVSACRKKESCKAYTFDKWNRVCYLKSTIGDFKLNPRSSSGVREDVRIPKAPSGDITMERYPSKAFPGSGYKSVKSDGPESCEQNCRTEEACIAFTFRLDEGSCHLFKTTGEYFGNELADSGGKRQD